MENTSDTDTCPLHAGCRGSSRLLAVAAAIILALCCGIQTSSAQVVGRIQTQQTTTGGTGPNVTIFLDRPILYLEDVLPCDQARCAYTVTVNETIAGPEAQAELENLAGRPYVEIISAETYSGEAITLAALGFRIFLLLRLPAFSCKSS
jgi:hypothetical protein